MKTIGLILEDAFTDFCSDIIHSVSFVVKDMKDIRLLVIPGRQDDSRDPNVPDAPVQDQAQSDLYDERAVSF